MGSPARSPGRGGGPSASLESRNSGEGADSEASRAGAPTSGSPGPTRGPLPGVLVGGLPYVRFGAGEAPLVLFADRGFENRVPAGWALRNLARTLVPLTARYTVYVVTRRPGLPTGFSTRDMAEDYARALAAEFAGPVDVMGLGTGGEIAQHFAADHPDLLRRLVLGSTAYRVGDEGRGLLRQWDGHARSGRWRALHASRSRLFSAPWTGWIWSSLSWGLGPWLGSPADPSDYLVTLAADLEHDALDRLGTIRAPTLVIAGEEDIFHPVDLVYETAAGIPGAWLELLPRAGHELRAGSRRRFDAIVLSFLSSGTNRAARHAAAGSS